MGSGFIFFSFSALLLFASFVMILLVLIQRGRGGGLAGAFGGMGGQSAFGTRAGDVFTKITVGVAIIWVLSAGILGISMRSRAEDLRTGTQYSGAEGADEESSPVKKAGEEGEEAASSVLGTEAEATAPAEATGPAEATAPSDTSTGTSNADGADAPDTAAPDADSAAPEKADPADPADPDVDAAAEPNDKSDQ